MATTLSRSAQGHEHIVSRAHNRRPPHPSSSRYWLSGALALLTIVASGTGVFLGDFLPRLAVLGCWRQGRGPLVTLVVAVPTLAAALVFSLRGSVGARIVWPLPR